MPNMVNSTLDYYKPPDAKIWIKAVDNPFGRITTAYDRVANVAFSVPSSTTRTPADIVIGKNGRKALRIGDTTSLDSGFFLSSLTAPRTVFMVADSVVLGQTRHYLFGWTNTWVGLKGNSNNYTAYNGSLTLINHAGVIPYPDLCVLAWRYDSGVHQGYINGTPGISATATITTAFSTGLQLGSMASSSGSVKLIYEFIVFERALPDDEINSVSQLLFSQYS